MREVIFEVVLPALLAAITVLIVHPRLVRVAKSKLVVDAPDSRKTQIKAIPVLGGVGVFLGIVLSSCVFSYISHTDSSLLVFVAMLLMLYTGVYDDIVDLSAGYKFLAQCLSVAVLVFVGDFRLNALHGLWGAYGLSDGFAIPLTFVAMVGVINAFNLIDGVDGLVAGVGIVESMLCGAFFLYVENHSYAILAFAVVGALIPFFFFNVFSHQLKMFFGDGGSLVLGLLMSVFIVQIDHVPMQAGGSGAVAMMLAVFSMPVFDTLRVMLRRIVRGHSPFAADRCHLHHALIDCGLTHIQTVLVIIALNLLIVAVWAVTAMAGMSPDAEFYIVVAVSVTATEGVYRLCRHTSWGKRLALRAAAVGKPIVGE